MVVHVRDRAIVRVWELSPGALRQLPTLVQRDCAAPWCDLFEGGELVEAMLRADAFELRFPGLRDRQSGFAPLLAVRPELGRALLEDPREAGRPALTFVLVTGSAATTRSLATIFVHILRRFGILDPPPPSFMFEGDLAIDGELGGWFAPRQPHWESQVDNAMSRPAADDAGPGAAGGPSSVPARADDLPVAEPRGRGGSTGSVARAPERATRRHGSALSCDCVVCSRDRCAPASALGTPDEGASAGCRGGGGRRCGVSPVVWFDDRGIVCAPGLGVPASKCAWCLLRFCRAPAADYPFRDDMRYHGMWEVEVGTVFPSRARDEVARDAEGVIDVAQRASRVRPRGTFRVPDRAAAPVPAVGDWMESPAASRGGSPPLSTAAIGFAAAHAPSELGRWLGTPDPPAGAAELGEPQQPSASEAAATRQCPLPSPVAVSAAVPGGAPLRSGDASASPPRGPRRLDAAGVYSDAGGAEGTEAPLSSAQVWRSHLAEPPRTRGSGTGAPLHYRDTRAGLPLVRSERAWASVLGPNPSGNGQGGDELTPGASHWGRGPYESSPPAVGWVSVEVESEPARLAREALATSLRNSGRAAAAARPSAAGNGWVVTSPDEDEAVAPVHSVDWRLEAGLETAAEGYFAAWLGLPTRLGPSYGQHGFPMPSDVGRGTGAEEWESWPDGFEAGSYTCEPEPEFEPRYPEWPWSLEGRPAEGTLAPLPEAAALEVAAPRRLASARPQQSSPVRCWALRRLDSLADLSGDPGAAITRARAWQQDAAGCRVQLLAASLRDPALEFLVSFRADFGGPLQKDLLPLAEFGVLRCHQTAQSAAGGGEPHCGSVQFASAVALQDVVVLLAAFTAELEQSAGLPADSWAPTVTVPEDAPRPRNQRSRQGARRAQRRNPVAPFRRPPEGRD